MPFIYELKIISLRTIYHCKSYLIESFRSYRNYSGRKTGIFMIDVRTTGYVSVTFRSAFNKHS